MVSTGEARESGASPVPAQGVLFADDLPELDDEIGYRGPTACRAAGITYRQLDYWARTGLLEPSVRAAGGSGTQRLYGFRDILVLKIVKRLLDTGVSLQQIRIAISVLRSRGVDDLAQITLMSDGASVYECTSNDEVIDLLRNVIDELGHTLTRVRIVALKDGVFHAVLDLDGGAQAGGTDIESRSSDAIALALRMNAPVLAPRLLLEEAGIRIEDDGEAEGEGEAPEDELERFKEFLDHVSPEDFELGEQP